MGWRNLIRCFLAAIVVGAAGAAFNWLGSAISLIAVGIVVVAVPYILAASSPLRAALNVGTIVLLVAILIAVILPMISFSSPWSRQRQCIDRLRAISVALLNYHRAYGSFPPACVRDKTGKPMHSWRVLILPYLGTNEQEVYSRYNLNEAWDSPDNRKLAALRPPIYVCPGDRDAAASVVTSYVAVVGRETVWPEWEAMKVDGIHRPSETIQLVEVTGSGINWMEPRDLSFDIAVRGVNRASGLSISGKHTVPRDIIYRETGACVVFCDGSGGFLSYDTGSDALIALLTVNGHNVVPQEVLDARRLDGSRCLSVSVLAIAFVCLLALGARELKRGGEFRGLCQESLGKGDNEHDVS